MGRSEKPLEEMIEKAQPTAPRKRWGCRRVLLGLALTLGLLGYGGYQYLKSAYERNPEEKKMLEGGIEALFEGSQEAQKYFSRDYIASLENSGFWKRMEQYELFDYKIYIDPTNERITHYFVRYKDKKTGQVTSNEGMFERAREGSLWKIAGE